MNSVPLKPLPAASPSGRRRWIRAQDVAWLVLFSALAAVESRPTREGIAVLLCLGVFQVVEPKIQYFSTRRGAVVSILSKLGLCYLLIGWTGGITSHYYFILLLPVLSAATALSLIPAMAVTVAACASYLSFLLFLDMERWEFTPEAFGELALRIIFLPVVAFLTHQLADDTRTEARRYQATAAQLEEANRSLQAAEAAMRRSDRLAALGQMTAGLAHELRNPLGTMRASAEMLVRNVSRENAVAHELAGFISSEVDRTNSLITRFLEFARPVHLRLQTADVGQLLDRAITELEQHNPPYRMSVHRNYSPDIPPIAGDPELLGRVFYNLLLNAAQATPSAGAITVKTRTSGEAVEISVIDRGSGIERKNLESIFNPFFTTKQDGVGLGLAIVSKIVDEHRGKIFVESEPGEGSVFRLYLPVR